MQWTSTIASLALACQIAIVCASTLPNKAAVAPSILFSRQNGGGQCPLGHYKCPNVNSETSTYCCLEGENCYNVEDSTAAICCKEGSNCGTKDAVACFQVDARAEKCGNKCCDMGYECVSSKKGSEKCQIKPKYVEAGAVPGHWDVSIVSDEGNEAGSRIVRACQPLVDKALAAVPKFPAFAIVVGFIAGAAAGMLATFGGQWLWRMRLRKQQEKILAAKVGRAGRRKRDSIFDDSLTYNPEREKDLFAIPRGFSFRRKGQPAERYEEEPPQTSVPNIPDRYKNPFVTKEEASSNPLALSRSITPGQRSNTVPTPVPHPAAAVIEHPPSVKKVKSMPQTRSQHSSARPSIESFETYTSTASTTRISPTRLANAEQTRPPLPTPKTKPQVYDSLASTPMPRSYVIPPVMPAAQVHARHLSDATSIISDRDDFESYAASSKRDKSSSKGRSRANSRPGTGGTGYAGGGRMYDVQEDEEPFGTLEGRRAGRDGRGDYGLASPTVPAGLFRRDGDGGVPYP
ncbi:hypothetical protein BJ508DRAFT_330420 [Ascobolus immersus RN42]|uniref:Uncharacterized protein n=1 Tax=Ascobolus immersus RN42 TaxID=1160509 RepID=A0A3N4HTN5_ASCIM|nr:hypothetical protein BJ508DRAFT_330420 [Ascobolus immersus RN42]